MAPTTDAEASTSASAHSPSGGGGGASSNSAAGNEAALPASIIDMDIFGQLLEMDEEDDREFSREIVWNYFDQAKSTFASMQDALEKKDLLELSTLGHFLKGSSAACGVIKVRDSCEYMQHYGKQRDAAGVAELSREDALAKLADTLRAVQGQYKEAEHALRRFYDDMDGFEPDELAPATSDAAPAAAAASAPAGAAPPTEGKPAPAAAAHADTDADEEAHAPASAAKDSASAPAPASPVKAAS